MRSSIRLGRIFGISIEIHVSWIFIFSLLTYLLVVQFDDSKLRWPLAQRWVVAVIGVALLFLSVLAHELSHSAVALCKGIPVRSITFFIFG